MIGVGIDFGTSNSAAAWYDGERVHMIALEVHDAIMANARRRQKRLLGTLGDEAADRLFASLDRLQLEAERMLEELDEA